MRGVGDGLTRSSGRAEIWKLIASSIGNRDEASYEDKPSNIQYRVDLEMIVIDELRDVFFR